MRNTVIVIFILMISVITGCNEKQQQLETMWYKGKSNYHEINNPKKIMEIKNIVDKIEWKGTEPKSLKNEPDFAFWIGRKSDNIRILHCDVWRLDSEHFGITKFGEEFDILNRYSIITQAQFNQILNVLGVQGS
ncbi:hypothetical protein [Cohnella lubricantis]|uniref:Lipoprotein n=1 Tax=Cohnella lubricantis TaxID=2163172 RepID=A0A841TES9_9BACL|nr:hypothetical protein [Cohnella lubricantis]MBB6677808.1 hypothetical protein [Cohnella lubricantis]MBP2120475.1 hypothetical protein [Cohnella lubricantis]